MTKSKIAISLTFVALIAAVIYFLPKVNTSQDTANSLVREHSPVLGPDKAPVTLVEFIDPACEACRAMYPYVKQIISENPEQIKLVIRYVDFHKQSKQAIQILEASRQQGQFAETLELLLAFQPVWAPHGQEGVDLWQVMLRSDLDLQRAKQDAQNKQISQVIKQDERDRVANGVKKTPGFFVNGKPLKLMHPDSLREMIQAELKQ